MFLNCFPYSPNGIFLTIYTLKLSRKRNFVASEGFVLTIFRGICSFFLWPFPHYFQCEGSIAKEDRDIEEIEALVVI
jgi:hypothetical protein